MSNEYLHLLRDFELQQVLGNLPSPQDESTGPRVLDIGAGTGRQAALLKRRGYAVVAVDLASSAYAAERVFPVVEYDGVNLPLDDASVNVVFSSNVLEHVEHLDTLLAETRRILMKDGLAIHILPTPSWRAWTTLAHLPWLISRSLSLVFRGPGSSTQGRVRSGSEADGQGAGKLKRLAASLWPARHGERGNALTEVWYFSEWWWRKAFVDCGFNVIETRPAGLFYTGAMLLAGRLSLGMRRRLATVLGSSCRIYILSAAPPEEGLADSPGPGDQTY